MMYTVGKILAFSFILLITAWTVILIRMLSLNNFWWLWLHSLIILVDAEVLIVTTHIDWGSRSWGKIHDMTDIYATNKWSGGILDIQYVNLGGKQALLLECLFSYSCFTFTVSIITFRTKLPLLIVLHDSLDSISSCMQKTFEFLTSNIHSNTMTWDLKTFPLVPCKRRYWVWTLPHIKHTTFPLKSHSPIYPQPIFPSKLSALV